ncbi:MAG: hypothetical protein ACD_79C00043G0001 [uncultured bacterium]|nr:MAG: hypothetical protein ACD_79C00043G0001 [uncultured bacterium]
MDNENSDIFFMPCASNEDEHIFILSRLAAMIKNTGIIDDIRKADTKKQIIESIEQSELLILKK